MSADDPLPWRIEREGFLAMIKRIDDLLNEGGGDGGGDGNGGNGGGGNGNGGGDGGGDHPFKVFEIIDHRNMPDLRALGMINLKIWYEGAMFDSRDDRRLTGDTVSRQNVNLDRVRAAGGSAPAYSVVDIERWADKHTWRVPPENVARYVEAMKAYKGALRDGHKAALYSIVPVRNYWDAISNPLGSDFKGWQGWNDEIAPVVDHVDMLMPSLYTFHDKNVPSRFPREGWVSYATANIKEARRVGKGKPVYPVLWPRFHPGNAGEIPGDYWRLQLDTCRKHADGVVIWDDRTNDKTDWSNLGDWWGVTEAWLAEIRA